ncbi:MAG: homoserine kinase [Myxococcaceae bacterium]
MKSVKIYVPATIGNVGPGFDVLGLAIEGLGNTYEMALCEEKSQILGVTGVDAEFFPREPEKNLVFLAAHRMAEALGHEKLNFAIRAHQELPVGGGLGSSAAACLAGAYGVAQLLSSTRACLPVAYEFETHYDNIAPAYYGGLTIASKDFILPVSQGCELWVVVVIPKNRLETKKARSVLPKELSQEDWVLQMGLSCGLVCAWQQGDLKAISQTLRDPYAEPRRALLMPGFMELKKRALDSGALGCSISGAGPTVFALFGDFELARNFAEQNKGRCTQVSKQGIRLC